MNGKDRNLIRKAKAMYCRYIDTKQWKAFASLFEPRVKVRIYDPAGAMMAAFDGSADFVKSAMDFINGGQSIHQIHNEEFEQISKQKISAIWSMEDYIVFPTGAHESMASVHGYGHYLETWRKDGHRWRIASLELRRAILEVVHRSEFK